MFCFGPPFRSRLHLQLSLRVAQFRHNFCALSTAAPSVAMLSLHGTSSSDRVSITVQCSYTTAAVVATCGVAVAAVSAMRLWRRARKGEHCSSSGTSQHSGSKHGPSSGADFRAWGAKTLEWLVKYRRECRSQPVISQVQPNYLRDALPDEAPTEGEQHTLCSVYADSRRADVAAGVRWLPLQGRGGK